jgi:hypothetical protein
LLSEILFGVNNNKEKKLILRGLKSKKSGLSLITLDLFYLFKYNLQFIIKEGNKTAVISDYNSSEEKNKLLSLCTQTFYEKFKTTARRDLIFDVIIKTKEKNWKDSYNDIPGRGFCGYLAMQYLSLRYEAIDKLKDYQSEKHFNKVMSSKVWDLDIPTERNNLKDYLSNTFLPILKKKKYNEATIKRINGGIAALENYNGYNKPENWIDPFIMKYLFQEKSKFPRLEFVTNAFPSGKKFPIGLQARLKKTIINKRQNDDDDDEEKFWFTEKEDRWVHYYPAWDVGEKIDYSIEGLKKQFIDGKNNAIIFFGSHFFPFEMHETEIFNDLLEEAFENYCRQLFYILFHLMLDNKNLQDDYKNIKDYTCGPDNAMKIAKSLNYCQGEKNIKHDKLKKLLISYCKHIVEESKSACDLTVSDDDEQQMTTKNNGIIKSIISNDEIISTTEMIIVDNDDNNKTNITFEKTKLIEKLQDIQDYLSIAEQKDNKVYEEFKESLSKFLQKQKKSN